MPALPLDVAAVEVSGCYPDLQPVRARVRLGNRGGFSGARLWRLETAREAICLRAWPPAGTSPERLRWVHSLMRLGRGAGLAFVPDVLATRHGITWVEHAGRLWDVTTWMPGEANFHREPTAARLEAACTALALLHAAWAGVRPGRGPCPAVQRRLARAREWAELVAAGWRPTRAREGDELVGPWAQRAWRLLSPEPDRVPRALAPWVGRDLPLQPCLCDVWHDHVLFEGARVTGLIDYGSVKSDHVAVDLARLLGSTAGDDAGLRAAGLAVYARLRPLTGEEEALVAALDETGTLLGAANWLMWLYRDGRRFDDPAAVARRLAELVQRLEHRPA